MRSRLITKYYSIFCVHSYCVLMKPVMTVAMSVYLPDAKDYRALTWHGIPPLGWSEYCSVIIMREVFTVLIQLYSHGKEMPPFDTSFFLGSSQCADKLTPRVAVRRAEEDSLIPASVWGMKRKLAGTLSTSTQTGSATCTSSTTSNTSSRDTNKKSTGLSNTAHTASTVQTPPMSSSETTLPASAERESPGHTDMMGESSETTSLCTKPKPNEMSPTVSAASPSVEAVSMPVLSAVLGSTDSRTVLTLGLNVKSQVACGRAGDEEVEMGVETNTNNSADGCDDSVKDEESTQECGCAFSQQDSDAVQAPSFENSVKAQNSSQPLVSPVVDENSYPGKTSPDLLSLENFSGAKKLTASYQYIRATENGEKSFTPSQESRSESCNLVGESSESLKPSESDKPFPASSLPLQNVALPLPNVADSKTNTGCKTDNVQGVTHSRLFQAMWLNLEPEECHLEIPGVGTCLLSEYLEKKPLESVAPLKGTVLVVDGEKYDARQVLGQFRRGLLYGRLNKLPFTGGNCYQTFASVRDLPDLIPFQVARTGVNRMVGMIHRDFSDQGLQGRGRPRRVLEGIWPINKEHIGQTKTRRKRGGSMTKKPFVESVGTVPVKQERHVENADDFPTGQFFQVMFYRVKV